MAKTGSTSTRKIMTYAVSELVPHSGAMSLLSEIVKFDDDSLHAKAVIDLQNPFLIKNKVPSWIGIEYMAQTISAWAGVQAKIKHIPIRLGFLVGTRNYHSDADYFYLGDTLELQVKNEINSETGLGVFSCKLRCRETIATANINVFQPVNIEEFLNGQP